MSTSIRTSLQSLKLEAYAMYKVGSTKQLKKLFGKGYDFRRRSTWLEILGKRDRPVYTGKVICPSDIWFIDGQLTDNNIVPFSLPLTALYRRVDEILGDDC